MPRISVIILALMSAAGLFNLSAQETLRPVRSAFMVDVGSSHLLDTYLSPLKYTGWHTAFDYERTQAMKFSPEKWRQQLNLGVELNGGENPARNATLLYGNLSAVWSMSRMWKLPEGVTFSAGGNLGGNLGGIYSTRNGNNPAALKADITLGVIATAGWNLKLRKLPVALRWQTSMPMVGMLFAQEYDELYYEMYLGNNHGLIHCTWPGNLFRWDNLVTADLGLGNSSLRVGFRSRIYSGEVNHITTRTFSYSFVLGVVTDWLSISRHKSSLSKEAVVEWAY